MSTFNSKYYSLSATEWASKMSGVSLGTDNSLYLGTYIVSKGVTTITSGMFSSSSINAYGVHYGILNTSTLNNLDSMSGSGMSLAAGRNCIMYALGVYDSSNTLRFIIAPYYSRTPGAYPTDTIQMRLYNASSKTYYTTGNFKADNYQYSYGPYSMAKWRCYPVMANYGGSLIIGLLGLGFSTNSATKPTYGYIVGYNKTALDSFFTSQGFTAKYDEILISDLYGEASGTGGYTGGTFDDSSDTISLPNTPSMGVTSAGFVNVYNPTAGELANLGSELFPDLSFTTETPVSGSAGVTEAIEAAANALVNFGNQIPKIVDMYINSNLIQYVIDCHILPVAPTTSGTGSVKVGFKTFTPAPKLVTSDYVDFDCGSLNIGEYYANFIDYAPYTKCKLFLPFVGFVDLQPEYWQSGTIKVVYRFNIIDGSFMAFVISTSSKSKLSNTVIAQYGGNACVHIPITGLNYSSMVSGVVSGAQAVISAQSGVQAATRAVNSAVDVMNAKPPVQQSNSYNATTSFLGVRTPYLLIERSVSNFSETYTDEKGVPSNISTSFSGLSGYTEATSVHLDGITGATSEELTEISELLARGVIL